MAPRPGRTARTCAATRRPAPARAGSARRSPAPQLGAIPLVRRSPGGVIRTRTCSNPHRNSGVSPAVAALRRNVDSRPCSPPPPSVRRAYSGSPSPPEPVRRSGSSCSPTSSTAPPDSSRSATSARPRTTRTGSSTSRTRCTSASRRPCRARWTARWLVWMFNHLYLIAQLGVIPAALIFLWFRNQPIYRTLRNTILATWLLSVPIYGLFPVAPPRLADIGIVDTISDAHDEHELELVDELLQRARGGAEPARRLRDGGRASRCSPRCATPSCATPRCCGAR